MNSIFIPAGTIGLTLPDIFPIRCGLSPLPCPSDHGASHGKQPAK